VAVGGSSAHTEQGNPRGRPPKWGRLPTASRAAADEEGRRTAVDGEVGDGGSQAYFESFLMSEGVICKIMFVLLHRLIRDRGSISNTRNI
jgi:hypothetical protein